MRLVTVRQRSSWVLHPGGPHSQTPASSLHEVPQVAVGKHEQVLMCPLQDRPAGSQSRQGEPDCNRDEQVTTEWLSCSQSVKLLPGSRFSPATLRELCPRLLWWTETLRNLRFVFDRNLVTGDFTSEKQEGKVPAVQLDHCQHRPSPLQVRRDVVSCPRYCCRHFAVDDSKNIIYLCDRSPYRPGSVCYLSRTGGHQWIGVCSLPSLLTKLCRATKVHPQHPGLLPGDWQDVLPGLWWQGFPQLDRWSQDGSSGPSQDPCSQCLVLVQTVLTLLTRSLDISSSNLQSVYQD